MHFSQQQQKLGNVERSLSFVKNYWVFSYTYSSPGTGVPKGVKFDLKIRNF